MMSTAAPLRGRVTATAGTVVFLVLALVGFYYVRTTSTAERLTDRNLRELDRIGRTIELRVNNFQNILSGLASQVAIAGEPAIGEELGRRVGLIPNGALECAMLVARGAGRGETAVRLVGQRLHFDYLITAAETSTSSLQGIEPCAVDGRQRQRLLEVSWPLTEIEMIAQSEFFDQLLLANRSDGTVFLSSRLRGGLRLEELPLAARPAESDESASAGADRHASSVQEITVAGGRHRLFLQPVRIELEDTSQGIDHTEWVVGGLVSTARFRAETLAFEPPDLLFLSLVLIFGLLAMPFLRLGLMGHRERLEVRDILLLGLSFLLASGVVGISLAALAHHQGVRATLDAQLHGVAQGLETKLGQELEGALRELKRQSDCFRAVTVDPWLASNPAPPLDASPEVRSAWEQRLASIASPDRLSIFDGGEPCPGWVDDEARFRGYEMIFWTHPDGRQLAKWTPNETNTSRVSVGTRDYFRKIRDRVGWAMPSAFEAAASDRGAEAPDQYFLESIESLTTGEHQAAVSRPFCWQDAGVSSECQLGIVAMIIRPVSLDHPVLPPGFEFALIDPDGRTLFHSARERNLHENFFEETDNHPLIRSVVAARGQPDSLHAKYMGRTRRLSIRPVSDTPLMLVVAMDTALMGTVTFESLFVAAVLFALYALVVLVCFAAGEALLSRRVAWAWPDPDYPGKHKLQMLVLAAFGVTMLPQMVWVDPQLSFFAVPFQALGLAMVISRSGDPAKRQDRFPSVFRRDEETLGWMIFALATFVALLWIRAAVEWVVFALQLVVALVVAFVVLRYSRRQARAADHRVESGTELRLFHSASLLLAMVVVGLLPGYQLFRAVFSEHLELLVRYHQVETNRALQDRWRRALDDRERRAQFGDLDLAFAPFLCTEYDVTILPPDPRCPRPATSDCGWGRDCLDWSESTGEFRRILHDEVERRIPFVTDVAVSMRRLSGQADVGAWSVSNDWPRARMFEGPRGSSPSQIVSVLPDQFDAPGAVWWLCLGLALALFYLLATWSSRRVFLSEISHAKPISLRDQLPPSDQPIEEALRGPGILFVCTRSTDRSAIRNDSRVHYIDLMASSVDEDQLTPSPANKIVCIDFFDHRFEESSWNQKLLAFVERLVYVGKRRVFLLTSLESTDLLRGGGWVSLPEEAVHRWARLLGQFVTVHVADESGQLSLAPDLPMRYRSLLEHECAGFNPLRKVAEQMAKRRDLTSLSEDAVIDQMREMAESHYRAVWTILPREERMVVAQLAAGAVVNPKSEEAIRHLLARRLLVRDPELRLMNESFGRFVHETVPVEEIRIWEREGAASTWQLIRFPILLGLGSAVAFLVITQQEFFSTATAFISTVAVGAGAVIRLLTLVQQRSGARPDLES